MIKAMALTFAISTLAGTAFAQNPSLVSGAEPAVGKGWMRRFQMMDADRDGKVTLAEFTAFSDRVFDRIDAAHKGSITKADLDSFMVQRQSEAAGRMIRGRGGDVEGAGERQLGKLSAALASGGALTRQDWDRMAAERFERMDLGHQGFLTPDDFIRVKNQGGAGPSS